MTSLEVGGGDGKPLLPPIRSELPHEVSIQQQQLWAGINE